MLRRSILKTGAALAMIASFGTAAAADLSGPVNYIIPFGPGGESDISARLQQPFFKDKFGQDLVVSYQPGGGGAVGWASLNTLNGDGQTIMGVNLPHIVIKPAQKDVGFTTADLNTFYMFHFTPDALIVPADSPYQSLDDLIADAKAHPGEVTISGSGKASANHLAQIKFDKMTGAITTYVPFKGTGAAVTALLGNQVKAEWGYTTVGAAQGEAVRMLAVAMEERHPLFPDVPTFKELGFDMIGGAYRGIALPNTASAETTKMWSDMIGAINADDAFRQKMLDAGFAMLDVDAAGMQDFMAARTDEYLKDAREAGLIK
ncbi:tripartite tricarboxylate transporter substrate binding protein [Roseobacter sp. N2S]|uniref:Bug family tripartite tricarboxylate transporter substrate binding protein n=1 Tax=Roseobacter sp. N2S TaxID=2663844 RepID=UPI002857E82E|nr:tripartite tricarboxylate transporter substrate binding protein [Roseobacter sp. N2S]MDR6265744.1 tripartite-type tricarboxylate transporter receptor subunit TctC [Roseobacter sp. N2S]